MRVFQLYARQCSSIIVHLSKSAPLILQYYVISLHKSYPLTKGKYFIQYFLSRTHPESYDSDLSHIDFSALLNKSYLTWIHPKYYNFLQIKMKLIFYLCFFKIPTQKTSCLFKDKIKYNKFWALNVLISMSLLRKINKLVAPKNFSRIKTKIVINQEKSFH